MKSNLLKSARVRKELTQSDLALKIEKTTDTYAKKERGEVLFTPTEIAIISNVLGLSFREFNDIFFDSQLQFSNISDATDSTITL